MDGPAVEARTTVVASATGEAILTDWLPAFADGPSAGTSVYPHLPGRASRSRSSPTASTPTALRSSRTLSR